MIRVALVGLGKMGLSHFAILNAHPDVELTAVCDSSRYLLDVIGKYTRVRCHTSYEQMLESVELDAVVIATPSHLHAGMVQEALARNLHVFCEKPFCLDPDDGARLADIAEQRGLANKVGYHYRHVAAFAEMRRLIDSNVLGHIYHLKVEAFGPVVLRPQGATWRSSKRQGGGCLYDYACHGIDLLNFMVGPPTHVRGTVLRRIFSADVEDAVHSTLFYEGGRTAHVDANWSDPSVRKMSTRLHAWGEHGKIYADRQEVQLYLHKAATDDSTLKQGWNTRYITDLEQGGWYYLRGEEYSAQIDGFLATVQARMRGDAAAVASNTFRSAAQTDRVAAMMVEDAARGMPSLPEQVQAPQASRGWFSFVRAGAR